MKNAFLIVSTLTAVGMIIFINKGMDTLTNAQSDSHKEVNELIDEVIEQQDASYEAMFDRRPLSVRMQELSDMQRSITTELSKEFVAASEGEAGSDLLGTANTNIDPAGAALVKTLMQQQAEIVRKFTQLEQDLSGRLQGIADQRHLQILENMREMNAATELDGIRKKLFNNDAFKAAESAKIWADHLDTWAKQLESLPE